MLKKEQITIIVKEYKDNASRFNDPKTKSEDKAFNEGMINGIAFMLEVLKEKELLAEVEAIIKFW